MGQLQDELCDIFCTIFTKCRLQIIRLSYVMRGVLRGAIAFAPYNFSYNFPSEVNKAGVLNWCDQGRFNRTTILEGAIAAMAALNHYRCGPQSCLYSILRTRLICHSEFWCRHLCSPTIFSSVLRGPCFSHSSLVFLWAWRQSCLRPILENTSNLSLRVLGTVTSAVPQFSLLYSEVLVSRTLPGCFCGRGGVGTT